MNSNLFANKKRLLGSPNNELTICQTKIKWDVIDSTSRQDKSHSILINTKAALDQTFMTISTRSRISIVEQVSSGVDLQETLDKNYSVKLLS